MLNGCVAALACDLMRNTRGWKRNPKIPSPQIRWSRFLVIVNPDAWLPKHSFKGSHILSSAGKTAARCVVTKRWAHGVENEEWYDSTFLLNANTARLVTVNWFGNREGIVNWRFARSRFWKLSGPVRWRRLQSNTLTRLPRRGASN